MLHVDQDKTCNLPKTTTGKEGRTCQLNGVWQIAQKQVKRINTSYGDAVHGYPSQQVVTISEVITRQ